MRLQCGYNWKIWDIAYRIVWIKESDQNKK